MDPVRRKWVAVHEAGHVAVLVHGAPELMYTLKVRKNSNTGYIRFYHPQDDRQKLFAGITPIAGAVWEWKGRSIKLTGRDGYGTPNYDNRDDMLRAWGGDISSWLERNNWKVVREGLEEYAEQFLTEELLDEALECSEYLAPFFGGDDDLRLAAVVVCLHLYRTKSGLRQEIVRKVSEGQQLFKQSTMRRWSQHYGS